MRDVLDNLIQIQPYMNTTEILKALIFIYVGHLSLWKSIRFINKLKPKKAPRKTKRNRLRIYLEPRDAWIGAYIAPDAVYICPLPFLVVRWSR
jgi:predicted membrane protein